MIEADFSEFWLMKSAVIVDQQLFSGTSYQNNCVQGSSWVTRDDETVLRRYLQAKLQFKETHNNSNACSEITVISQLTLTWPNMVAHVLIKQIRVIKAIRVEKQHAVRGAVSLFITLHHHLVPRTSY
jgi:hypothetical protein